MKIKTSELTGAALDWAVAKCEKVNRAYLRVYDFGLCQRVGNFRYSTDWAKGGPIIEREDLCIGRKHQCDTTYCPLNDPATDFWARTTAGGYLSYGPTHLIAAMCCYVASELGDEVEVPDELM